MQGYLRTVARETVLPDFAIGMCSKRIEESGPALRAVLAEAADGAILSQDETRLAFRGLYILGAARDTQSWPILLRLLRRPGDELDDLLGDGITEALARIVAGMFDDNAESLFALIADRFVDEYVRLSLFGAAAFLTWDGRIELHRMRAFLEKFYAEKPADKEDLAWEGWLLATALLGLRDLAPLFRVWLEDRIDSQWFDPEDFEEDIARAEKTPADTERFRDANLGYIDDVIAALRWPDGEDVDGLEAALLGEGEQDIEDLKDIERMFDETYVNPMRHVGRNDPCPCGSGKKAKKCCLG